mmetsp:Transcript_85755/g.195495  ORF Transcript_85755/g.195495 Transcript_85755/m.195495 type:complete len:103 (+) Transcript_85755:33-341(+)
MTAFMGRGLCDRLFGAELSSIEHELERDMDHIRVMRGGTQHKKDLLWMRHKQYRLNKNAIEFGAEMDLRLGIIPSQGLNEVESELRSELSTKATATFWAPAL